MLNLRYTHCIALITFALLLAHAHRVSAQETAPAPGPGGGVAAPAPATPPQSDEIADFSGQQLTTPSASPGEGDVAPTDQASAQSTDPQGKTQSSADMARLNSRDDAPPAFRANGVHLSVLGLLGRFRLTYERFIAPQHGLVVEGILNANLLDRFSPDTDDASDATRFLGYGGGAGYRWHWRRSEQGGFVGGMLALEHGSGSLPVLGDPDIRWSGTRTILSITPAVGGRWVWESGFCLVLRGGMGYAHQWIDHDPGLEKKAVDQYDKQFFNVEAEFSLGYVF